MQTIRLAVLKALRWLGITTAQPDKRELARADQWSRSLGEAVRKEQDKRK